jgi:ribosomal protein S6--L-glutamate ligase
MRFAILSGGTGWHVRDLTRAARVAGHESANIDFRSISASLGTSENIFKDLDGVVVRTMPSGSLEQVVFRMDVLHGLSSAGIPVVNAPRALETCVDKYLAGQRLLAASLPVPPTIVTQNAEDAMKAFAALGGDVVVKPIFGSEGRGMVRVSDPDLAWRTFHLLERLGSVLYLQKFIPHPGWDIRAFILDGRVLGAMRRRSGGAWRTNIAQGGTPERCTLNTEEEQLAVRAAAAVGAVVAGVDLLSDNRGHWYIPEVNAVPGWRSLAAVTEIDVAAAIIQFMSSSLHNP